MLRQLPNLPRWGENENAALDGSAGETRASRPAPPLRPVLLLVAYCCAHALMVSLRADVSRKFAALEAAVGSMNQQAMYEQIERLKKSVAQSEMAQRRGDGPTITVFGFSSTDRDRVMHKFSRCLALTFGRSLSLFLSLPLSSRGFLD